MYFKICIFSWWLDFKFSFMMYIFFRFPILYFVGNLNFSTVLFWQYETIPCQCNPIVIMGLLAAGDSLYTNGIVHFFSYFAIFSIFWKYEWFFWVVGYFYSADNVRRLRGIIFCTTIRLSFAYVMVDLMIVWCFCGCLGSF